MDRQALRGQPLCAECSQKALMMEAIAKRMERLDDDEGAWKKNQVGWLDGMLARPFGSQLSGGLDWGWWHMAFPLTFILAASASAFPPPSLPTPGCPRAWDCRGLPWSWPMKQTLIREL